MSKALFSLPTPKTPTVLTPAECQQVVKSYGRWVSRQLQEKGGKKLTKLYFAALRELGEIQEMGIEGRAVIFMLNRTWADLRRKVAILEKAAPDLIAIHEMMADLGLDIAEVAELVLRNSPLPLPDMGNLAKADQEQMLRQLIGLGSLEDAMMITRASKEGYHLCFSMIVQRTNASAPNDPARSQLVLVEQIAAKYMRTLCRLLLMKAVRAIEQKEGREAFETVSLDTVVPRFKQNPEIRQAVLANEELAPAVDIARYTMAQPFNSKRGVCEFFANTGDLAVLLGDLKLALKYYEIARSHADDPQVVLVDQRIQFLHALNPSAKA